MNITTRQQFDELLRDLDTATIFAVDTETSGLRPYGTWDTPPNRLISMSFWFPHTNHSYNVAFRHGEGQVEVSWGKKEPVPFESLTWQGKAKGQMYLGYWYSQFKETVSPGYFQNLPIEWLAEIQSRWGRQGVTQVYHNARFDLHVLANEGFPIPWRIVDTMILLHMVNEDWRSMEVDAPFKWNKTDAKEGRCDEALVGQWARALDGSLLKKKQQGNRQLKWQAAFHGFPGATEGEEALHSAIKKFETTLADFICQQPNHPYNAFAMRKKLGLDTAKIRAKVALDEKSNMWMLPSSDVAFYAELDTRLTWYLYEWCMAVIRNWKAEAQAIEANDIHLKVAWMMEHNGFRLDREQALRETEKLTPRIEELELVLETIASQWGFLSKEQRREKEHRAATRKHIVSELRRLTRSKGDHSAAIADLQSVLGLSSEDGDEDETFNPSSNPKLLSFLNSGVLGFEFGPEIFPEWWPESGKLDLKTYPTTHLSKTDKEALEPYEDHPIIRLVKAYRTMKKSRDTYLKRWLKACDPNGTVRFSMNTDGTVSWRFSSSGDAGNGQNIPDRNGYTIKKAIIPYSDEWVFFAIDYGQLELRRACHIAETVLKFDPAMTMTRLFESGADMHAWVRDDVGVRTVLFGDMSDESIIYRLGYTLEHEDVQKLGLAGVVANYCRQVAKTMNFGLLYDGTEYMLKRLLRLDNLATAKVLVDRWKRRFPAFSLAQQHYMYLARTRRPLPVPEAGFGMYVQQDFSGRYRKFHKYPTYKSWVNERGLKEWFNPQEAETKKAWNNVVQGDCGYICTASFLRFYEQYGNENLRFFAQIHDAGDGYVRRGHEHLIMRLAEIMVDWPQTPELTVDLQMSVDGTWQGIKSIAKGFAYSKSASWDDPKWQAGYTAWVDGNRN